jgi:thiol-disulfide isomerase/thioredoxin
MKKFVVLQVCALVLVSGVLGGMFAFTPVYDEVRSGIVLVLCLSCLKLEPKTIVDFTFKTADNKPHPGFVLENLSEGVVFLFYSGDSCHGCDVMYPVIKDLFSVDFGKQDIFQSRVTFENSSIGFVYVNIDHTIDELRESQPIYYKDNLNGVPMFTIVTLGYDNGVVKPKYTTFYGDLTAFGCDTDAERLVFLQKLLRESIEMYKQNEAGYPHL